VQSPKHVLFGPLAFSNRYTVRPLESTRIQPNLPVLSTLSVAVLPLAVFGGPAAALLLLLSPPTVTANTITIAAAPTMKMRALFPAHCCS
jgi:hypothetical protein